MANRDRELKVIENLQHFWLHAPVDCLVAEPKLMGQTQQYVSALVAMLAVANDAQVIVETGVFKGHTAVWLAHAARCTGGEYFGYDTEQATSLGDAKRKLKLSGLDEFGAVSAGRSPEVIMDRFEDRPIDLIFIDDNHEVPHVRREIEEIAPLMAEDGLMCFHDCNHASLRDEVFAELGGFCRLTNDPQSRALGVWRPK